MRTINKIFTIIFVIIVFLVLPFFIFGTEGEGVRILGNFKTQRDFTGQPFEKTLTAIDKFQVGVENRLTGHTPFYTDILSMTRDWDMWLNKEFFGETPTDSFSPVGNTKGTPVMMNGAKDLLIWDSYSAAPEEKMEQLASQAALYTEMQQAIPKAKMGIYIVTEIWNSPAGVESNLGEEAGDKYIKEFAQLLPPQIKFNYLKIPDITQYRKFFFKTDHHWNMKGAYQGYIDSLALMSPNGELGPPIEWSGNFVTVPGIAFQGSRTRMTLIEDMTDDLWDIEGAKLPEYTITVNDKPAPADLSLKEEYWKGQFDKTPMFNHYAAYFRNVYAKVTFDSGKHTGNNLLFLADSNANCMDTLLATHFDKTHVVNLAYWKEEYGTEFNIKKFAEDNHITHVLVMQGPFGVMYNTGNLVIEVK